MAVGDFTTLANVKAFIPSFGANAAGVTGDDTLLGLLITQASQYMKNWLNRDITQATYSDTYSGMGGVVLTTDQYPITAVASVTVDGVSIPSGGSSTVAGFYFDTDCLYLTGYAFTRGLANVQVTYTAGYAATPPDLEMVCISLVARKYRERERIGLMSQTAGQQTTAFGTWALSPQELMTLQQWKSVVRAA